MAIETLYEKDGSLEPLSDKTVAVLGYGSQGHAHAQNLRDSGVFVIVANRRESENGKKAIEDGFEPMPIPEAVKMADVVLLTLPDEVQPKVFREQIEPHLEGGMVLGATHGFNVHFGDVKPPENVDVVMVAPKGPGHVVRSQFEEGGGVPCLMAVHQDASGAAEDIALAWAIGIGGGKGGTLKTTFQNECETDLFGEQTVLCGGISQLVQKAYEVLVEAGYPEELAYFEVCHELKLIIDLVVRGGFSFMHRSVSNTAEFGSYWMGPAIVNEGVKARMEEALEAIQSGEFAEKLRADIENGSPCLLEAREEAKQHPLELKGKELRRMMSWLNPVEV